MKILFWSIWLLCFFPLFGCTSSAKMKTIQVGYHEPEMIVYLFPDKPTQIIFPEKIIGGYKCKGCYVSIARKDNYIVALALPDLFHEEELHSFIIKGNRTFIIRFKPAYPALP